MPTSKLITLAGGRTMDPDVQMTAAVAAGASRAAGAAVAAGEVEAPTVGLDYTQSTPSNCPLVS